MYNFTIDQIESRVLADCNIKRLKEHRQCDYCHLIWDCNKYKQEKKMTLCQFLDEYLSKIE